MRARVITYFPYRISCETRNVIRINSFGAMGTSSTRDVKLAQHAIRHVEIRMVNSSGPPRRARLSFCGDIPSFLPSWRPWTLRYRKTTGIEIACWSRATSARTVWTRVDGNNRETGSLTYLSRIHIKRVFPGRVPNAHSVYKREGLRSFPVLSSFGGWQTHFSWW